MKKKASQNKNLDSMFFRGLTINERALADFIFNELIQTELTQEPNVTEELIIRGMIDSYIKSERPYVPDLKNSKTEPFRRKIAVDNEIKWKKHVIECLSLLKNVDKDIFSEGAGAANIIERISKAFEEKYGGPTKRTSESIEG